MRIMFVTDNFPPITHTGPSIVALNLAQELFRSGHEVFVVTSTQDQLRAGSEIYEGIKIHRIYSAYPRRFNNYFTLYNPQIIPEFKRLIAAIRPDVCHFHNVHDYLSYHCFKFGRKYSRAVFLTAHDMMLISYGKMMPKRGNCNYKVGIMDDIARAQKRYNPFRNIMIRHYLKYIDKIFCITDRQKQILATNGIKNTATIHNAIEADKWLKDEAAVSEFKKKFNLIGKKIVMFGGRLSIAKGGDAIFAAIAGVTAAVENSVLLVVGEVNDYARNLMAQAQKNLVGKVVFTGWLNRAEIMNAFFSTDVCVTPSIYFDPFNLFNIEAMSAAKPVVGTCFGGTPEIVIDSQTGYIVNPLQTEELAAKIIDLLSHPDKAEEFGRAGRLRVVKEFSVTKQVEETLRWYGKFMTE